ncbi:acyl-ACP thioesterase [Catenibacillus scindens]|uniref:Acyl-ACP thioesterase n=1 Tax=Catenibacillus scindens TaxID=673271 RepID=A0A7W8HC01_9FIRM|nr:acyl-ACP thioesterase domain-containing protein [Catenibacillus scindens]MBB5265634.1 acyl-ACP thioesterase [Catenibacillus scindens]
MFTYERKVTYSEVASDAMADVAQIVRYFQDCSTMQSESLGMGIDFLAQHSHVWMLTAWQIQVMRRPRYFEEIVTGTWAYGFDSIYGYRNFLLKSSRGEILAVANSIWILANTKTGKPERLTGEMVQGYGSEEKYPMVYAPRRIALPKTWEDLEPFEVRRSDLDTNNHVNNARYIDMALEYADPGVNIYQLRVEYKKAARYKDKIWPRIHRENNKLTVALCDKDQKVYVAVEIATDEN